MQMGTKYWLARAGALPRAGEPVPRERGALTGLGDVAEGDAGHGEIKVYIRSTVSSRH